MREEELKERRLKELQVQEDKVLGILAKRQLRIEHQIAVKQSPLQRARRIRNKRQEELRRIHSSINGIGATEDKTCEKRLSKRLNSCHSERGLVKRLAETNDGLPEEDMLRSSSSISLPAVPAEKQIYTRRNSLPIIYQSLPAISQCNQRPSLPNISNAQRSAKAGRDHSTSQPLSRHKLPPLKKVTVG